jgi:hypothetical protein
VCRDTGGFRMLRLVVNDPSLAPIAPEDVRQLVTALDALPSLEMRLSQAARPRAKSRAEIDGQTAFGRIPFDLALTATSIGFDHLAGWHALVTKARTMPTFGSLSLLRGALEGAVLARWLLAPSSTAGRLSRGFGAQWEDYEQRRKFEQDAGSPTEPQGSWKPAKVRRAELERAARRAKVDREVPPSRTDLFRQFVFPATEGKERSAELGRVLYRVLSASAHGYQWAILVVANLGVVDEAGVRPDTGIARVTGRGDLALRRWPERQHEGGDDD